jgi:hypothetical protein
MPQSDQQTTLPPPVLEERTDVEPCSCEVLPNLLTLLKAQSIASNTSSDGYGFGFGFGLGFRSQ